MGDFRKKNATLKKKPLSWRIMREVKFLHRCMSELKCYHQTLGKKIATQTKSLMPPSKVKYKMLL